MQSLTGGLGCTGQSVGCQDPFVFEQLGMGARLMKILELGRCAATCADLFARLA